MLKVTELRGRLRVLGLLTRGRKSELVARLRKGLAALRSNDVDKTQTTPAANMQRKRTFGKEEPAKVAICCNVRRDSGGFGEDEKRVSVVGGAGGAGGAEGAGMMLRCYSCCCCC